MVTREAGTIAAIIVISIALVVGISSRWFMGKTDSPIEECAEYMLEKNLGLREGSLDLSPDTPEEVDDDDE